MFREARRKKLYNDVQFNGMKKLDIIAYYLQNIRARGKINYLFFFNRYSKTFKTCIEENNVEVHYFIFYNYFLSNWATYI